MIPGGIAFHGSVPSWKTSEVSMAGPGSVVVRRQLGKKLRSMRLSAGKSLEDVSEAGLGSPPKMSRIENGKTSVRLADARELARFYGADEPTVQAIGQLALGTQTEGWWEAYGDLVVPEWFGLYVGLEFTASHIRAYEVELLHGLVQIEDYARALFEASTVTYDAADIDKRVRFRMERQQSVLSRDPAPRLDVIVGPGALLREVGGRSVMRKQVAHLHELEDRGLVNIRVLPWRAGAAPIREAFALLDFEDVAADPAVTYVEIPGGARYLEAEQELSHYRNAWAALYERSVPLREHTK
jgi:transcriptional regulator with XRE-family HTH domain